MRSGGLRYLALVVLLLVVVNLPLLHGLWTERQVSRDGVDVVGTVVDHDVLGRADDPRYVLEFTHPPEIEDPPSTRLAYVDEPTYEDAVATERIEVRVLPDEPDSFRADGESTSSLLMVITVIADLVLLALLLLIVWRPRNPLEPEE